MKDMKKIDDKKRRILISVVVLVLFLTLAGGTFAWLIFGMDILNGNYMAKTKCFDIVYDNKNQDGTMDIEGTLVPSTDYSGGLSGSMAIGSSCTVSASGNLIVHLNSSDSILTQQVEPHCEKAKTLETLVGYNESQCNDTDDAIWVEYGSALKYMVFEEGKNNAVSVGYIDKTNEDIKIYKNFRIRNRINEETGELELSKYIVYIWLDFNISDSSYSFASFSGYMYADATQNPPGSPEVPVLDTDAAMIPVTIANDGTVTTVSPEDPSWYNYSNKEWANVVLVQEDGAGKEDSHPRIYYQNNLGVEVTQDDILAYYVWIPRYKYKIPYAKCSDIENPTLGKYPDCYGAPYTLNVSKEIYIEKIADYLSAWDCPTNDDGVFECTGEDLVYLMETAEGFADESLKTGYWMNYDEEPMYISDFLNASEYNGTFYGDNYEKKIPYSIDIAFEKKEEEMKLGNATTEYRTHPSFWWDDDSDNVLDKEELLSGIWVGKFETTPDKSSTCYTTRNATNCNNSTQNPTILPNEKSLGYQNVSNQFYTSKNFSKSGNIYGLDNETINAHMMKNRDWGAVTYLSHSKYGINGEIRNNNNYNKITGCGALTKNTLPTSNCENSYGTVELYPQSTTGNISGIFDIAGGSFEFVMGHYGTTADSSSGFTVMPKSKYYDLYSEEDFIGDEVSNLSYCTIDICGGHALNEIDGWYRDDSNFVESSYPWFTRGGGYGSGDVFYIYATDGDGYHDLSWRSVLVPEFGD